VGRIGSVSGILLWRLAAAEENGHYMCDFQIFHAITDIE
jgi:hypothetical protein